MFRPLEVIVAAILLSRPGMLEGEASRYAKLLQQTAKQHAFDPLTGVAIIHHESGWRPELVSADGEDYGLGQIRARYIGACRSDADPLNQPSLECQAVKASLLDPASNIRTMATLIDENRALCRKKTGRASLQRWLASYQGRNYPKARRWCQPGTKTWQVVRYRSFLLTEVAKKRKSGKRSPVRAPAARR